MTNTNTLIPISKTTRDRLKSAKIYKRETYDELINRIFDRVETHG